MNRWLAMTLMMAAPALRAQVIEYMHTNAIGTPVAMTNSAAQVLQRAAYRPYGGTISGAAINAPGFAGHVRDEETGNIYMQQRYYDPVLGRFLSVDPVTAHEKPITNFNRYTYSLNNPYRFVDPDGRDINCAGRSCTLVPSGGGLPTVTFPRPEGFPDRISASASGFSYHMYRFKDPAGSGDAAYKQRLGNELVENPTPIKGKSASTQGNLIDVNADNAISVATGKDHVMSYKVNTRDKSTVVLNVTTGDHAATWGIVLRTIESGPNGAQSIVTYGEGDSMLQRVFDPNNAQSRAVWSESAQQIMEKTK